MDYNDVLSKEEIEDIKIKIDDCKKGKVKYSDIRHVMWNYLQLACFRVITGNKNYKLKDIKNVEYKNNSDLIEYKLSRNDIDILKDYRWKNIVDKLEKDIK